MGILFGQTRVGLMRFGQWMSVQMRERERESVQTPTSLEHDSRAETLCLEDNIAWKNFTVVLVMNAHPQHPLLNQASPIARQTHISDPQHWLKEIDNSTPPLPQERFPQAPRWQFPPGTLSLYPDNPPQSQLPPAPRKLVQRLLR